MSIEGPQSEETQLINENIDDIEDERCSTCLRFPKAVYFIVVTELCERFNYYGMRTILILYLTQHLWLSEGNAVSVYHLFVSLCYFTTIIGSFISDNYLGKFKTLLVLCSIYTFGSSLMSLTAVPQRNLSGPMISLILISLGTGGVKACVGPFGGDQIPPTKRVIIDSFFSMFYFAINLGALLSTILTPILRADVACNGSDDCYPLAFGVPAILMGAALVIFIIGRSSYIDVPVRESIYMKSVGCIFVSLKNWFRFRKETPKKEFLDYASDEYSADFIHDLRTLSRIAILYLPLPVYWALYEQMGSRWTLQAAQLDGELSNTVNVLPDQLSILNVIFVMLFIPIFDSCIYPICYKIKPKLRPLRRMSVGISFTCLSFVAAFTLQLQIESGIPPKLIGDQSRLYLVNTAPCDASMTLLNKPIIGGPIISELSASSYSTSDKAFDLNGHIHDVEVTLKGCKNNLKRKFQLSLVYREINFLAVGLKDGNPNEMELTPIHDFHKSNRKGHPLIKLLTKTSSFQKYHLQLQLAYTGDVIQTFEVLSNESVYASPWHKLVKPGRYTWSIKAPNTDQVNKNNNSVSKWMGVLISNENKLVVRPVKIVSSAVTLYYVTYSSPDKAAVLIPMPINNGSTISIAWQVPQYLLISIGEVLVSITGLSFSYDQAPDGMKSLVNAFWYLSNAFGNIIVMVVAKMQLFDKLSWEYLTFAGLCLIFNVIFGVQSYYYRMKSNFDQSKYESMMEVTSMETVE